MGEYPRRSELAVGDFVEIAIYRQGNKKDKGEIESILTRAETHPHGIMAALTDKKNWTRAKETSSASKNTN